MSDYTHHPLEYDRYFHIYNRGINGTKLFRNTANCELFLKKYTDYINPVAETFAWALIVNHFHLLVKIKTENEIQYIKPKENETRKFSKKKKYSPTWQFAHLFDSYTKKFNIENDRTGGLFERPFRRKLIENENYLKQVVYYIHYNPVKHGLVKNLTDYKWTSYHSIISDKPTKLKRENCVGLVWVERRVY
jgi:putative transposase